MKNNAANAVNTSLDSRLMFMFSSLNPEIRKQKLLQYLQFVATDLELELWKKWAKKKWLTWSFSELEKQYNNLKEQAAIETDSKKISKLNWLISEVLTKLRAKLSLYDKKIEWDYWYKGNEFDYIWWININYYWPKKCYYISSYNRAIKLKVDYIKWEDTFRLSLWNNGKPIYSVVISNKDGELVIKQIKSLILLAHKINEICCYYWNPLQAHNVNESNDFVISKNWTASIRNWEKNSLLPKTKIIDFNQLYIIINEWRYVNMGDSIRLRALKVKEILLDTKQDNSQMNIFNTMIERIFQHINRNWKKEYPNDYWHK